MGRGKISQRDQSKITNQDQEIFRYTGVRDQQFP